LPQRTKRYFSDINISHGSVAMHSAFEVRWDI